MKKLLLASLLLASFAASAQKNTLLEQEFWKNSPDVKTIQAEIDKGNNPAQLTVNSFDAVVYAINAQAPNESIKYLLQQKGNDVNKLTHDSRTYLFWAANRGNAEIVEYLISKGAKANITDSHGFSPLNFAAASGQTNTQVYDILIKNGADLKKDVNTEGANALLLAISADKNFALTNYFESKGLNLKSTDANGNTAFNYVARSGNVELLKALVQKGVKYNDNAIIMAAQGGRGSSNTLAVYEYLEGLNLKPGFTDKDGANVLHYLARKPKQSDIINHFIAKGVDLNQADKDGNTPFMNAAASNNDLQLIEQLSAGVKNINHTNAKGVSALAMAVRGNSPEVVSLLISKGADINITDSNGDNLTAYLIQSYNERRADGFDAKVKLLQEKGFDLSAPQKNGNNVYHLAVAKNDLTLIKKVQNFKADINGKNKEGLTALHKAAMIAHDDTIMQYLLSSGAKKDILTDLKETPFDLASENEYLSKNKIPVNFLK
jgi:ankyrin repeat protein